MLNIFDVNFIEVLRAKVLVKIRTGTGMDAARAAPTIRM